MKAYADQSGTGLVLYDAWAVPGVINDMCCLLKRSSPITTPNLSTLSGQPGSLTTRVLDDTQPQAARRRNNAAVSLHFLMVLERYLGFLLLSPHTLISASLG